MDGVKSHKITISINFNAFCSQNAINQPKSTVEVAFICPLGLLGSPAGTLTR